MKRLATTMLLALAVTTAMCATARPAAAAPTLQFFQMGDLPDQQPAGAWFAFPTGNYCGLFHLYFIQGTDPNGPIYNPDGTFSLPLADGIYDFTLLGSGGITGPEANLILSFAEGSFTIDTLHPNGSATFGQTTVTVTRFTFENYNFPGLTDRIGTCAPYPDRYVDAVGHLTLEVHTQAIPTNSPPDVSAATPSVSSIWPPNNKMVDIAINGVTDPDGDTVSITIDNITNNETGSSDAGGLGTSTAQVRASRNGKGSGRTYTISFTAADGQGGSASGSVQVVVPHDQGKRSAKPAAVESTSWGEIKSMGY